MTKLCEKCGERKASFFYQENKNGVKKEICLCAECAGKLGLLSETVFDPFPLFSFPSLGKEREEKACPVCGTKLSQIRKKGKFGCSVCYDTFSHLLDLTPFIGNGYSEKEIKKTETKNAENTPSLSPIEKWKKELQEALKKEEYEKAA
ncbi:MAG: hypothetical protein IKU24_01090, partial [Clostridia bacterium]|nr:hypothetical protein [Clostridia bacterium]